MKNIVLIGFMGSGKSSAGQKLAHVLGYEFTDTDALTEERAGKEISEIFNESGEAYFRDLESKVVKEVVLKKNQVIACGGGAVLRSQNVTTLREIGIIVYLKTTPAKIYERIKFLKKRPLLNVTDVEKRIINLLAEREKIYETVADIVVDTSNLTVDEVVEEIRIKLFKEKND
ncbi:MAG: shikimate kinase [Candidatus Subteraquimicrobiales bacterium]|nr:shikimate kinase [Candidatus Subteraquimicrobiales bacterium]